MKARFIIIFLFVSMVSISIIIIDQNIDAAGDQECCVQDTDCMNKMEQVCSAPGLTGDVLAFFYDYGVCYGWTCATGYRLWCEQEGGGIYRSHCYCEGEDYRCSGWH